MGKTHHRAEHFYDAKQEKAQNKAQTWANDTLKKERPQPDYDFSAGVEEGVHVKDEYGNITEYCYLGVVYREPKQPEKAALTKVQIDRVRPVHTNVLAM